MYKKLYFSVLFSLLLVNSVFAFSANIKNLNKSISFLIDSRINLSRYSIQIFKFAIHNKCIRIIIANGLMHDPSYIFIQEEGHSMRLLDAADNEHSGAYPVIYSPVVLPSQDGGYSVFWLRYSMISDESLRMARFDSSGTIIINNKLLGTFNVAGSNLTIKQLSNQNYIVGSCYYNRLLIRIYDYNNGDRIHQFYPDRTIYCSTRRKTKIMPISNGTFVFSAENKLWHFDNDGNEIPFN